MKILLDTNSVWSIIDNDDLHHSNILEFIKSINFGNLCVLPMVLMEFRARYNKELNQLIARIIQRIDSERGEKVELTQVNTWISQVANQLSNQNKNNNDTTKIHRYETQLHKFSRDTFKDNVKLNRSDFKDSITSLKIRIDCITDGQITLLIKVGYQPPNLTGETAKEIMNKITENGLKFSGTADSMIAGEILHVAKSNATETYEFISSDKTFVESLNVAKTKLGILNINAKEVSYGEAL